MPVPANPNTPVSPDTDAAAPEALLADMLCSATAPEFDTAAVLVARLARKTKHRSASLTKGATAAATVVAPDALRSEPLPMYEETDDPSMVMAAKTPKKFPAVVTVTDPAEISADVISLAKTAPLKFVPSDLSKLTQFAGMFMS